MAEFAVVRTITMSVIAAGVSIVWLGFGLANHRSAEGGIKYIATQAIWIAVSAAIGITLLLTITMLAWRALFR